MPGNVLNITIGGTVSPSLTQATTQAAAGLNGVSNAANAAGRSLNNLAPFTRPSLQGLSLLGNTANTTTNTLNNVGRGANQAGNALMNLGRVAQDAPFGFIGIQNNLNPLLESFQRLRAETGSGSAAFRALAGSLIGPAGIGLALSLVSSAVVIFQNGISGFNKKTKEAKEATDELAKAIKSISLLTGEAVASVQGQIVQVSALSKAVSDSNLPYAERKRALEELKEINKAYFNDLKIEDAATGELAASVSEYTKALVNSAIQKQFVDEIASVAKAIAKSDEDIRKAREALGRVNSDILKQEKDAADFRKKNDINSNTGIKSATDATTSYSNALAQQSDARKALNVLNDTGTRLQEQRLLLENQLNSATLEGLKFQDLQSGSEKKATDALKQRIDALKELQSTTGLDLKQREELVGLQIQLARRDGIKLGFTPKEIEEQVQALINEAFQGDTDAIKVQVPLKVSAGSIDVAGAVIPGGIADNAFDNIINAIRQSAINKQEAIRKVLADSIQNSILQGAIEGFSSLGDTLGQAVGGIFSGEGFGSALAAGAKSFLGVIGSVLQEVGKQIIATSTLIKLLKEKLATLFANPVAGIAVGIGLVALGGLLKNINFKLPGFAGGVTNFSGGAALVGERGPELVTLPAGANVIPNDQIFGNGNNINVTGVIRGEDIYLTNSRIANRRRRI